MSYYDRLTPERKALCQFTFLDGSLTAYITAHGLVIFEKPVEHLSPANLVSILRELERRTKTEKAHLNALFRDSGLKVRV